MHGFRNLTARAIDAWRKLGATPVAGASRTGPFAPQPTSRSLPTFAAIALTALGVVAVINYLIGPERSVLVLYALPVGYAAWRTGSAGGISLALLGAAAWLLAADRFDEPNAYWNAFARFGVLALLAHVISLHRELRSALRLSQAQARTDPLTGLLNSRAFHDAARIELSRVHRSGRPVSLVFLDLDDFKQVNDQDGHEAGDRVLQTVSAAIRSSLRVTDLVGRVGGDEFVVLMADCDGKAAGLAVSRIRVAVATATRKLHRSVTFSIGVGTWTKDPPEIDAMLSCSDGLMYAAKREGKDRVRVQRDAQLWHDSRMRHDHGSPPRSASHPGRRDGELHRARAAARIVQND